MEQFSFVSFVIGFLLGCIILLLLTWISYFTRTFIFTYCPISSRPCGGNDYYNDPGDGLAHNPQVTVNDVLFLNDQNELFYKRIPRVTDCVPEYNQLVYMKFPQYCSFTGGETGGIWKETSFNSNIYEPVGFTGATITTDGNCIPSEGSSYTSGVPVLRWDKNPIS